MSQRKDEISEVLPGSMDLLRCRICHDQCLVATSEAIVSGRQTLATSRKAMLISEVQKGRLDWSPAAVGAIYSALSSGVQHEFCVHLGDPAGWPDETPYVRTARREIVRAGRAPEHARSVLATWKQSGNPYGLDDSRVAAAAEAAPRSECRTVLFADAASRHWIDGCFEWVSSIAGALAPRPGIVSTGSSGFELFDLGYTDEAGVAFGRLADALEGIDLVVSDSPEAVWMVNEGQRRVGCSSTAKALHVLPYLLSIANQHTELALTPTNIGDRVRARRVTYHDPSYLSRYGDGGDEAREVISEVLGAQLVEMMYNRRRAMPAGPFLGFPDEKEAIEIGVRRVEEAIATGAEVLLTASPFDYFNLNRAAAGAMEVAYLPTLVQLARIR